MNSSTQATAAAMAARSSGHNAPGTSSNLHLQSGAPGIVASPGAHATNHAASTLQPATGLSKGTHAPSTSTSTSSLHHNHDAGAALVGASIAFQKPKPKLPALATTTPTRDNGALAAATMSASASIRARSRSPAPSSRIPGGTHHAQEPLSRHATGGTGPSVSANTSTGSLAEGHKPGSVALDTRMSSVIAATLAARSASPVGPRSVHPPPGAQMPPGLAAMFADRLSRRNSVDSTASSPEMATDTSSIGPTMSVVSLFEQKAGVPDHNLKSPEERRGRPTVPRHRSSSPKKASSLRPTPTEKIAGRSAERPIVRHMTQPNGVVRSATNKPPGSPVPPDHGPQTSPIPGPKPSHVDPQHASLQPSVLKPAPQQLRANPSAPVRAPEITTSQTLPHARPQTPPKPPRLSRLDVTPTRPLLRQAVSPPTAARHPDNPGAAAGDATPRQGLDGTDQAFPDVNTPRPLTATTASSDDTFVSASSMPSPRSPSLQTQSPLRQRSAFQSQPASPITYGDAAPFASMAGPPILIRRATSATQIQPPPPPPPRRNPTTRSAANHNQTAGAGLGIGLRPSASRGPSATDSNSTTTATPQALDSLTSAIMAGSLAARMTPNNTGAKNGNAGISSSGRPPPPPSPARAKSPPPRLRETLRHTSEPLTDDEADKLRKRRERNKKLRKRHAHDEGSRKRWRDEITVRERRRYEAVWASNRGLLLDETHDDDVANLVVRDIWIRSRLPDDELGEVWDLVDTAGCGLLGRKEFVVGMWIIDQRLKGRKIPTRVSDSVWQSAASLGIKHKVKH